MMEKNLKTNAILNMIKTISTIIFPLITFPYVSRVLMPENIGKINFGSSFVSYFTLIASLGISTYAIRECSSKRKDQNELSKVASQIFSINVITTVIAYVLMAITLLIFRNFDSYRTLIIIQSTAILFSTLGCDWLNSAMEDFTFITVRTIAFQFVSLILMFVFVHHPEDYLKYAVISVVSSSGANIVNIFYRKKYCTVRFVKQMDWGKHFRPIMLLFVMILAQTIFNSSDITMLGLMKGDYEVGLYSTAVKIVNLVSQLMASLFWVVMPSMSTYFENSDYKSINKNLNRILRLFTTFGFPCATGCILLSKEIMFIVAGEKYVSANATFCVLMVGFIFSLFGEYFLGNMTLLPSKREAEYMKIYCVSMALNLILNYILIPIGGTVAAAFTTVISHLFILIICIYIKDKNIAISIKNKDNISVFFGCISIALCCTLMKRIFVSNMYLVAVFAIVSSIISYLIILYIMKNELLLNIISEVKGKLKQN